MDDLHQFVRYKILNEFEHVSAFTSSRKTLAIRKPRFTGDAPHVFENRSQMSRLIGISPKQLIFPRQTHSNCVAEVLEVPETEIADTDALVTNQRGICLCVQTADCVPVLLFDPKQNAIAAIHAGWRGTVSKIVERTLKKMSLCYGSIPENMIAAIGPSIGPDVYEVGEEVVAAAKLYLPHANVLLHKFPSGKFHFNLWEANRLLLTDSGVKPRNIELSGECSFTDNYNYFSARKEGIETGRMVSGIMLTP